MTRLTEVLERVASAVEEHKAPAQPLRVQAPVRKLEASTLMLAIPDIGEILREQFETVPAERIQLAGDQLVVTCECGREHTLSFGDLVRCSCWRFFFNARTVKVSVPVEPTEIVMCDDCDDDLAVKDGAWIRVAGEDRFVCADCHAHLVAAGPADLFGEVQ